MDLRDLQNNWDTLGKEDPLWAILSLEGKKGNKWDLVEFFRLGEEEIREVMQYVSGLNLGSARHDALDFGCGVGRLTRPLANYFSNVTGIDIAPSMIARARTLDRDERCRFVLNEHADLSLFSDNSFDFIYSNLVLQHMQPEYSTAYIREFCRVLRPGGVAIFQVPSKGKSPVPSRSWKDVIRPLIPPRILAFYRHRPGRLSPAQSPPAEGTRVRSEMHPVAKDQVIELVETSDCRLVEAIENEASGPNFESWRYCVVKP
jgi:ubiquinone/menaquinone biosynthesis C-methylase UbiE